MSHVSLLGRDPSYSFILEDAEALSSFRTVFGSKDLRGEFAKFLRTIFYQLDEKKFFSRIDQILSDPLKGDREIYEEMSAHIHEMRRSFPAIFWKLKALSVLQKGMGLQTAQLLRNARPEAFQNYLEVYFRRYLTTIRKAANLPLNGRIFDVSDKPYAGTIQEKLEAGSWFSKYPYRTHVSLNDADCKDPAAEPEKTHKPIGEEVPDDQIDLISCLGGLHHIPEERVEGFVESMHRKLKPGGVVLLRDHNVTTPALHAIASVVHSVVNAEAGVPWAIESKEVRNFQSAAHWTELMERHHFTRISPENLVLPDDPTQNGMMIFVKNPENLEELRIAAQHRKDCIRPIDGTKATWIEWGNVRYSKQFAEFIQDRHAYAFDYLGHLKQHWVHFSNYFKEARKDLSLKDTIFASDNFSMNLFIALATTVQCLTGFVGALPSRLIARVQYGVNWRNATDLTDLERYQASVEKEYSEFIDHTPSYMFPYVSKIQGLWSSIYRSNESLAVRTASVVNALFASAGLLAKAAICAFLRFLYTKDGGFVEPDRVAILIEDPYNQVHSGERVIGDKAENIEVLHRTPDDYKLVLVPRYRPFTELCKELAFNGDVRLIEIGSQRTVTVDVLHKLEDNADISSRSEMIYETPRLQDPQQRTYRTYKVPVEDLAVFQRLAGIEKIEYVHE